MCVSLRQSSIVCLLLALLSTVIFCSCGSNYDPKYVEVDYYIVNSRQDEILVKSPEAGIVGFFLAPAEVYHFSYHGDTSVPAWRNPEQSDFNSLNLKYDFFISGPDGCFDEYICTHEFTAYLLDSASFVDTFFVR
jgi:hypothetical protein